MAFDTGHALIIGIGTYQNAPDWNAPITAADAQQLAAVVRDPQLCGYPEAQVTLLTDGQTTRAGVLQALADLATRVTKDATVLLFYSGHGHYGEDGAYYLTTTDMQITANRKVANGTAIRQDELLAALQRIPAERMLLIFNACHAGALSPTLGAGAAPAAGTPLPEAMSAALLTTGSGRVIITACRENQFAYVGDGATTIFVQALLDGLHGRGITSQRGFISAFDLYTQLYFTVADQVETIPVAIRQQYSLTQEPELTVLQGVGPFAVALYQGSNATLGDWSAPAQPAPGTAVRAVDEAASQAARAQIDHVQQTQSDGVNFGVGTQIGQVGSVVAGDSIERDSVAGDVINAQHSQGFVDHPTGLVTQTFGDQRNVSMSGGDYTEGNIDKSSGTHVAGSQYNLSGNVSGSNVNIGSTLTNVTQQVGTLPGTQTEKDALQALIAQLHAALQQAPADRQADAEAVATFAQQLFDSVAKPQPNKAIVQLTAAGLKQAAASLASVMPRVELLATQIVDQIGTMLA